MIVLEMGGSSDLCAHAEAGRAGDPDGTDRHADRNPRKQTVLLVGGGLGNAVLFSIGAALRAAGSQVIYFAGYKKMRRPLQGRGDRARRRRDRLVLRRSARLHARPRAAGPQPSSATSCEAMAAYGRGDLGEQAMPLERRGPHDRDRLGPA